MLRQRQEGEAAALHSVQRLQEERQLLQERLGSLQQALVQLEAEKREVERMALRLEKDRGALRRTLDKVGRYPGLPPLGTAAVALTLPLARCGSAPQGPPDPLLLFPPRWNGRSFAARRTQCG